MDNGYSGGLQHSGQSPWGSPYHGMESHRESISHADRMLLHRLLRPVHSPVPGQYEFANPMSNPGVSNSSSRSVPSQVPQSAETGVAPSDNRYDDDDEDGETYDDDGKEGMKREHDESRSISGSPSISSKELALSGFRPHAAVEKRYRRTVNAKLQQLHMMIPPSGKFALDSSGRFDENAESNATEQAAKPVVLDKAIQYTNHLIETYQRYDDDIKNLRQQVRDLLGEECFSEATASRDEAGVVGGR